MKASAPKRIKAATAKDAVLEVTTTELFDELEHGLRLMVDTPDPSARRDETKLMNKMMEVCDGQKEGAIIGASVGLLAHVLAHVQPDNAKALRDGARLNLTIENGALYRLELACWRRLGLLTLWRASNVSNATLFGEKCSMRFEEACLALLEIESRNLCDAHGESVIENVESILQDIESSCYPEVKTA